MFGQRISIEFQSLLPIYIRSFDIYRKHGKKINNLVKIDFRFLEMCMYLTLYKTKAGVREIYILPEVDISRSLIKISFQPDFFLHI